jgi:hypothetical protein
MSAARGLECPIRSISSLRLAPCAAAIVFPVCRRSWKCSSGRPTAPPARYQTSWKFDRRSRPPLGPTKTNPFGLGSAKRSRWSASSGTMSAGNATVRVPARLRVAVDEPPVVHFPCRGVHADLADAQVELTAAQSCQFTEAQVGERRQGQQRPVSLGHVVEQLDESRDRNQGAFVGVLLAGALDVARIAADEPVFDSGCHDGVQQPVGLGDGDRTERPRLLWANVMRSLRQRLTPPSRIE